MNDAVSPLFGGEQVRLIPDRFYLAFLPQPPTKAEVSSLGPKPCAFYPFDAEYVYEPFDQDFGPFHLGYTIAYCRSLSRRLADPQLSQHRIYHWTRRTPAARANAAVLAGAYLVLKMGYTPEQAAAPFAGIQPPLQPFRDALPGPSTFPLTLVDVLRGLAKARTTGIIDPENFDLDSYLFYSRVEHGDMSWILPNRPGTTTAPTCAGACLAFSGPVYPPTPDAPFTPADYVPYFKKHNVGLVIRLNQAVYPASHFEKNQIRHLHLFFPDGSVPPRDKLLSFLRAMEAARRRGEAVAVHCRAGLGRTGSLICSWLIYKLGFTAMEALGYIRLARPGSVLGPQQHWLQSIEKPLQVLAQQQKIEHDVDTAAASPSVVARTIASTVVTSSPLAHFTPAGAKRAPPTLAQAGQKGLRSMPAGASEDVASSPSISP